jgi:hypothetical protein
LRASRAARQSLDGPPGGHLDGGINGHCDGRWLAAQAGQRGCTRAGAGLRDWHKLDVRRNTGARGSKICLTGRVQIAIFDGSQHK